MPVVILDFESQLLRGNALGDPHARQVPVYLPPSYERDAARRFPAIYFLAGFTGDGRSWLGHRPFEPSLTERFEALLTAGQAKEAILVMPDCFTRFGGSEYMNSPATGRYFDHVVDEIVPAIDSRFRTLPTREHRGIAGKSSGGVGALRFAMVKPDLFGACASHSGDLLFDVAYPPWFLRFVTAIERRGGVEAFIAEFPEKEPKVGEDIDLANVIAMCQAYSASHESPGFHLPFDVKTGEIDQTVFARWLKHDPVRMVDGHAAALRSQKLLFFDCGRRDEYYLHLGGRALARKLGKLGIAFEHEEYDGTHSNTGWRYSISLAKLSCALAE